MNGTQKSQRQLFEEAWGDHGEGVHPDELRLHVERRAADAQTLTFREMCGESAFIPPEQLSTIRAIGEGSFASVELAKYRPPGGAERVVAVKQLTSLAAVDVADFASEANILRKLRHPNIVEHIGVGSSDATRPVKHHEKASCYMVQEFMNAGNLKQKVWAQASSLHLTYSDHSAIEWARQVADGLAYLHSANPVVLHRDLKLENILLKEAGRDARGTRLEAKICDFGLAVSILDPHFKFRPAPLAVPGGLAAPRGDGSFHDQMRQHVAGKADLHPVLRAKSERMDAKLKGLASKKSFKAGPSRSVTRGSLLEARAPSTTNGAGSAAQANSGSQSYEGFELTGHAGSFLYMAPEVVMSEPYNEKADIFSLGVILLQLFMRKPLAAVVADNDDPGASEMFAYKVAGGYRHPLPNDWPAELRQLIADCWQQNPEKRPPAGDVAARLAALERGELFRGWEAKHESSAQRCCAVQ